MPTIEQIKGWIKLASSVQHRGYVLASAVIQLGTAVMQLQSELSALKRQYSYLKNKSKASETKP